jgi:hypothetical protein
MFNHYVETISSSSTPPLWFLSFNTWGITFRTPRNPELPRWTQGARAYAWRRWGATRHPSPGGLIHGKSVDRNRRCANQKKSPNRWKTLVGRDMFKMSQISESIGIIMYHYFEWFINITSYNWDNKQRREVLNFGTCSVNQLENRWTYRN